MAGNTNELVVWQWNCASFKRRRAPLLHFVASQAVKPHVIMLQETLGDALTFPGYRVVSVREQGKRGLATLVAKKNAPFMNTNYSLATARLRSLSSK